MYDWANSAVYATVITAVFPDFFSGVAGANLPPAVATGRFALATTIAVAAIALVAPVLGAIADYAAIKKRMLAVFMAVGAAAIAAMVLIDRGDWVLASALFIIANIGAAGSLVFYDSLLPHVARSDEIDDVSSAGYALGYLGGGLLLAVNLAWILAPRWFGLPDQVAAIRLSFLSVAVWWVAFSTPLLRRVSEPPRRLEAGERPDERAIVAAFGRLARTLGEVRGFRQAFLMMLAVLLYNDGIQTIIRMASIYGAEIGIGREARIAAFVMVQFVGIPFAVLFGKLAGRIGAKPAIFVSLAVYAAICVLGYYMSTALHFFVLAALVAMVQGGSQALSRSLFARMIPRYKSSEYFGFFSVFEKFAGVLGPAVFAGTIAATGSSRGAVLSVLGFFVAGAAVLAFVNVEEGERAARHAELTLSTENAERQR
jgi:UMF1 family MFS transporter